MKKPDEYVILERAHEEAGSHMMQKSPRADELIACLEGEIVKRDARIAELEADLYRASARVSTLKSQWRELAAELAALKEQEPAAYIPVDRETGEEWHPVLKKGSGNICDYKPLYAAPVVSAEQQVVADGWAKDAEEWGRALNEAGWVFIEQCPEKSALLFNNTKAPLRAAILKYAELVTKSSAPAPFTTDGQGDE